MNTPPASRAATVTTRQPRRLSELAVSPHRVSVLIDGQPMQAVRVPVGTELVWRIKLADRLSKESFADADQAVHWLATCATLPGGADAPKPDLSAGWVTSCPPEAKRPDPIWQKLDWEPRLKSTPMPKDPTWVAIALENKQGYLSFCPLAAFAKTAALLAFGHGPAAQ